MCIFVETNDMNISIIDAFNQTVRTWDVDLNSDYPKSESQFCISKMFDLFDLSGKNVYETKLFIESVETFVNSQFNSLS